ncbi:muskelin [Dichotomocladium elegans]|nr:muskelin [Dichotomocladium elegans]
MSFRTRQASCARHSIGGWTKGRLIYANTQPPKVAKAIASSQQVRLEYTVQEYSSYCGSYHPHNIRVNKPSDQSSRWSSGTHDQTQYLILRLDRPAVACSIVFGKYQRAHVCNLREFKVYGGMDPNDMVELLHSGLQNTPEPETFPMVYSIRNLVFPVQYIKIIPLATFGPNFNYSIWYLELRGVSDTELMARVMDDYQNYRETETLRLCLKHFRQRNMMDLFYVIKNRTGVDLEHPFLTELHQHLVLNSDFDEAERVLEEAHKRGFFEEFITNTEYTPCWKRIWATTTDGDAPCGRGGHQMCIDPDEEKIYLFGGWNGEHDLADLWCYSIRQEHWELLSTNTENQGGPSPRSCHKICFDPETRSIFVLGKFVDPSIAAADGNSLDSDFYRYFVDFDQWVKMSDNTARQGGPGLLFDHQMCIDAKSCEIFVFGGRLSGEANGFSYGPLYSFHIPTNTWRLIRYTTRLLDNDKSLLSRVGHSMLFDPTSHALYIFAGQRIKDYMTDLCRYHLDEDRLVDLGCDYAKRFGPKTGFAQRATIDSARQEIHVFVGHRRRQATDTIVNEFWIYDIEQRKWKTIYQSDKPNNTGEYPSPRFAHEMVYNPSNHTEYIFGGNPGDAGTNMHGGDLNRRLADFWELQLIKPDPASIYRKCLLMIRMQHLRELCRMANTYKPADGGVCNETLLALEYLQSKVATIVDHNIPEEARQFRQLCAQLCLSSDNNEDSKEPSEESAGTGSFEERTQLFDKILEYLPAAMKEPTGQLLDAVKLV